MGSRLSPTDHARDLVEAIRIDGARELFPVECGFVSRERQLTFGDAHAGPALVGLADREARG